MTTIEEINEIAAAARPAPIPDLPFLRKILDHIDDKPETWVQRQWASFTEDDTQAQAEVNLCDTAFCIAGHAVNMTEGVRYSEEFEVIVPKTATDDELRANANAHYARYNDGEDFDPDNNHGDRLSEYLDTTQLWSTRAQELLGLTKSEADDLFGGHNTRKDITRYATEIAARAGEEL